MNYISILWLPFIGLLYYEIFYKKSSLLSPISIFICLSLLNFPLRILYLSQGNFSSSGEIYFTADIIWPAFYGFLALCSFTSGWYINLKKINFKIIYKIFFSRIKFGDSKKIISVKSRFSKVFIILFLIGFISISLLLFKAKTNLITYILQSNFFRLGINQSSSLLKLGLDLASFISSFYGFVLFKRRKFVKSLLIQGPILIFSSIFGHRGLAVTAVLISIAPFELFYLIRKRLLVFITPIFFFINAIYASFRDSVYRSLVGLNQKDTSYFNVLLNNSINAGMHGIDSLALSMKFVDEKTFSPFSIRPFIEFLYPLKPWLKFLPNPTHVGFNRLIHGFDYDSSLQFDFVGGIIETLEGWSYLHYGLLGIIFVPFLLAYFLRNIIHTTNLINYSEHSSYPKEKVLWFGSFYCLFFFLTVLSSPAVAVSKTLLFSIILRLVI